MRELDFVSEGVGVTVLGGVRVARGLRVPVRVRDEDRVELGVPEGETVALEEGGKARSRDTAPVKDTGRLYSERPEALLPPVVGSHDTLPGSAARTSPLRTRRLGRSALTLAYKKQLRVMPVLMPFQLTSPPTRAPTEVKL